MRKRYALAWILLCILTCWGFLLTWEYMPTLGSEVIVTMLIGFAFITLSFIILKKGSE